MSDYNRMKVIRMRVNPSDFGCSDVYEISKLPKYKHLFAGREKINKFDVAPTEEHFIDYILFDEYPSDSGDYGFARYLSDKELQKFIPLFKNFKEDVSKEDLRFVDFCWYTCCEAPDYFDVEDYG